MYDPVVFISVGIIILLIWELYLCPPPGMWCLCHFQLKPWRLPIYQRGPRYTAGSLWSPWKSKPEVVQATLPTKEQCCEDREYFRAFHISLVCLQTCPCTTALRSCRTACLASGGCSGDSMSSTDFHTASTACWGICVCTDVSKHKRLCVPMNQVYRPFSPLQTFWFWQGHKLGSTYGPGCSGRSPGGAPGTQTRVNTQQMWIIEIEGLFVCIIRLKNFFFSTHLDDVGRNDKLRRFAVALFTWRPWSSQSKDPLHLVPETFFAWLLIHCWVKLSNYSQSWADSYRGKTRRGHNSY